MSKKQKLDINKIQLQKNKIKKEKKALNIKNKIFPVLSFLERHGIDHTSVNSYSDIVEHFRKDFPFPNAPDARNFELLGIDTSGIENAGILKEFNTDFFVEGNQIKVRPEWYQENEANCTFYTRTESDDKALDFANKLIKLVTRGHEQGFLSNDAFTNISNTNELAYFSDGKVEYRAGRIYDAGDRHDELTAGK